ncbi:hypothetical protein PG995_009047 [Apiospora arundinis]
MAPMRVLISGCGVGGPSLAIWLARLEADVTVVERCPDLRVTGQQIDIRGQAVDLLDSMGIKEALKSVVTKEPGAQLVNQQGQTVAFFPTEPASSSKQGLSSEYEIMRGDLVRTLYNATKETKNVRYWFNKSIESFTQDDEADPAGKVHVHFSDGHQEDFDLVVGADGVYSKTRKIMMGPKFPDSLASEHTHFAFFSIPSRPNDSDRWTICLLPKRAVLMSRRDHPDFLRAYMMIYGDQPSLDVAYATRNKATIKEAWAALFRSRGWEADRFCDGLLNCPEADDLYAGPVNFVKLPEGGWSQGRVTLLGDAACSSTLNGKGTMLAMVAGYVLAGEIIHEAIRLGTVNYEKTLRPLAEIAQKTNENGLGASLPETSCGIRLLHLGAWVASHLRLDKLGYLSVDGLEKWKLPEYPSLLASVGN